MQAAGRDLAVDRAAAVLFDNHAGSAEKMRACRALEFRGWEARLAAPALVRQTRYNIEPVREAARVALIAVAGDLGARSLQAPNWKDEFLYKVFCDRWVESMREWGDLGGAVVFLRSPNAELRGLGVRGMQKLSVVLEWDVKGRERNLKPWQAAAAALADCDRYDPSVRDDVLDVFYRLGVDGVERHLVPVALRAAADGRARMKGRGTTTLARLVPPHCTDLEAVSGLVDAALWEDKAVAREAQERLELVSRSALSIASAECIAAAIERGHPFAHTQLGVWRADPRWFARATQAPAGVDPWRHMAAAAAGEDLPARYWSQRSLLELLGNENPRLRERAVGRLLPGAGGSRVAMIVEAIQGGVAVHESVLEEVAANKREFSTAVLPALKDSDERVVLAALHALMVTGYLGEPVDDALKGLLRGTSSDVRRAAARVIGTEAARAMAHVGDLLARLRSDVLAVRLDAARELHRLGVDREEVTRALVEAVERGDMLVREGLTLALERGHGSGSGAMEALKELAKSAKDPATRVYVRAALRAVEGDRK